jgi:hypothetical protein
MKWAQWTVVRTAKARRMTSPVKPVTYDVIGQAPTQRAPRLQGRMDPPTMKTVLVNPQWNLERIGGRAGLECDIALVEDDDDTGLYEIRVALNGERLYTRVWETHAGVTQDADSALHDLIAAGWVLCEVAESWH